MRKKGRSERKGGYSWVERKQYDVEHQDLYASTQIIGLNISSGDEMGETRDMHDKD
jgi:hypothetical protein